MSRVTLSIQDIAVFEAQGGRPEVEYALFEPSEIELRATGVGSIREAGYRTTAGQARGRLDEAGFTATMAERATTALRPAVARAYARSAAARCVVGRLEPVELLESLSFDGSIGRYQGTWLDFGALAADLGLAGATQLLRATYLAALLATLPEDAPLFLDTSALAAERRPGERTYRRVELLDASSLVDALGALKPMRGQSTAPEASGPNRAKVIAWLRARAARFPQSKERLEALEASLAAREAPTRGALAETTLWNVEAKLARGETAGLGEQIDTIERRRGRVPGTMYLRARLALATDAEDARVIAERVAALSTSMAAPFHELELLAAQAWAKAGDHRRARAFAHNLQGNTSADDVLRMHAHELIEGLGAPSVVGILAVDPRVTSAPEHPPAPASAREPTSPAREAPPPVIVNPAAGDLVIPRPPRPPSGTSIESSPVPRPPSGSRHAVASPPASRPGGPSSLPPGTSLPPYRLEPRGERSWSMPAPVEAIVERVEMLRTPDGTGGEAPDLEEPPTNPPAARLMCTFLARELARELRLRFGVDLRSDVDGLETAQRYLREALVDGRVRSTAEQREVLRHGAFLAELFARRLAGRWVDLEARDPGGWAMLVPSRTRPEEVARVWPFARVLRFVALGHRERDLVAYYLEVEARAG